MKIVVIARVLNEAPHIEKFCKAYQFADSILLTEGGSEDGTRELASQFPNVKIRDVSSMRVSLPGGGVRTPNYPQNVILWDWANENDADLIIHDDVDSYPNSHLAALLPNELRQIKEPVIKVRMLYIWRTDQYFKKPSLLPSLYAWRPKEIDFRPLPPINKNEVNFTKLTCPVYEMALPALRLHYFCLTEEITNRKMRNYHDIGTPQEQWEDGVYWPPSPIENWML